MPTSSPWIARVWAEFHAGYLTRAARDVLLTLRTYRGQGGACFPSHATLAERVGCSDRTVRRALALARDLGLVSWVERRVRSSWRWLRTSNSYRMTMPPEPLPPTTGHGGRRAERKNFKPMTLAGFLVATAALHTRLASLAGCEG